MQWPINGPAWRWQSEVLGVKMETLQKWLAVSAGGKTVCLVPVGSDSNGPDVFCKAQEAAEMALKADAELDALRKDAALGRFVRPHIVELVGGWQINQTFIHGAPSLEEVTDAIDATKK